MGRKRLVALAAACALIVCAAVYSAHGIHRVHEHMHCDLCVHFSGSAGAPVPAAVPGKPLRASRAVAVRPPCALPTRSPVGKNLPRGPPRPSLTAI